jgi:aquaporin Z
MGLTKLSEVKEPVEEGSPMYSKLFMEFIGTFFLCLTVGLSAALSSLAPLAIGGVLMCFVYAGAHVSGANYNPAVSFALALRGALPWQDFALYSLVQLAASVAAGAVAVIIMMTDIKAEEGKGLAAIGHPAVNVEKFSFMSAFFAEVFYTFALCFVVLNVATAKGNKGNQSFGMAVGFTVTAGACSGGPVSGGAFNPAVGFGLPLIAGAYKSMLIYLTGPFVGAALAAGMFALTSMEVREKDTRLLVFEPH